MNDSLKNYQYFSYFTCIGVSSACMSLYHLDARCLERPEEVIWSLELELYIAVSVHVDAGN